MTSEHREEGWSPVESGYFVHEGWYDIVYKLDNGFSIKSLMQYDDKRMIFWTSSTLTVSVFFSYGELCGFSRFHDQRCRFLRVKLNTGPTYERENYKNLLLYGGRGSWKSSLVSRPKPLTTEGEE